MSVVSINGTQKVLNMILSRLIDYKLIKEEKITKESDIEFIIRNSSLYKQCNNFEKANSKHQITSIDAFKYTYSNGLEYFTCNYTIGNNFENEYILLRYCGENILYINTEKEKKSPQELLSTTINEDYTSYIQNTDKVISSEHSYIGIDDKCYFEFMRFMDITQASLVLERFKKYQELYIENISEKQENLLMATKFLTLEILYYAYHPMYVQFSNTKKYAMEEQGYLPYKEEDILEVVNTINLYVEAFLNKANKTLDEINKKDSQKQLKKEILF